MAVSVERLPGLRRIPTLARRVDPEVVLFSAWAGRYADSPRAVWEELRRRDAPLEAVWVLHDDADRPEGATVVRPGGTAFLAQLGRARWIVTNNKMPGYFRKKAGTTFVQTWHGTPLKRIAFDIDEPAFADSRRYLAALRREVAAWDFLISPNSFSTEVFRHAFEYGGRILETGYPRNDSLLAGNRNEVRARVRRVLGIPADTLAVLYAPTWRDDASFSTELDLTALADELGDGVVVLLRAHTLVAGTVAPQAHPRVRDVSEWDEVADLMLAADVLVTDYSSVMFDFAVTGKPMLFFAYDLERYRDVLRGFYFDFTADAPGPVVRTTAELVSAVRGLADLRERYGAAYAAFRRRFCHLEDGHAAARVVDAVFGAAVGSR